MRSGPDSLNLQSSDGLQKLPTIKLRPEGESIETSETTPRLTSSAASIATDQDFEKSDQVSRHASVPPPLPSRSSPRPSTGARTQSLPESVPQGLPGNGGPNGRTAQDTPTKPQTDIPELVLPESAEPEESKTQSEDEQDEESLGEKMLGAMSTTIPSPSLSAEASHARSEEASTELGGGTSGADLLLPIIIYAIVKTNPNRLVSHLLYTQRYRADVATTGEAQYASVNMTAAIEFLEHVDLAELGLSSSSLSENLSSVTDLEPIGLTNYYHDQHPDTASILSASSRLRGRVVQVGELAGSAAGSANKVITGVVDSSWTALRGLMVAPNAGPKPNDVDSMDTTTRQGEELTKPRMGMMMRRSSGFTLANVTATVASIAANATTQRQRAKTISTSPIHHPQDRELKAVTSRPTSIREVGENGASDTSSIASSTAASEEQNHDHDHDHDKQDDDDSTMSVSEDPVLRALGRGRKASDVRSIKSVSSVLSKPEGPADRERLSIHERFANMGLLGQQQQSLTQASSASGRDSPVPRAMAPNRRTTLLNPMDRDSTGTVPQPLASPASITSFHAPQSHWTSSELASPIELFMQSKCRTGQTMQA